VGGRTPEKIGCEIQSRIRTIRLLVRLTICLLKGLSEMADFLRILISILLPPLGVFLQVGFGTQFWINIVLTILGYFPGVIHAVYVIAKK
jgi:uncharacterized membrane protein YqaE (UPF0057 family)